MNLLVIIDSNGKDPSLGVSIEAMMKESQWTPEGNFAFVYKKRAPSGTSVANAEQIIKKDVDNATFESEWKNVKYMYLIGQEPIRYAVSPGI